MDRVHYMVSGLVNSMSKTHVKNALEKIDGVNEVCVDLGRGSIEVIYNEQVKKDDIKRCIEDTGYHIES
ncbi:Copper chaperone CopZ [Clostridium cavendishii DSM 21758]|uniref:Copper chaperone CopZ n=1 Tax=Clostridium cavendishii DSM 21758 TaxID=1121302 RepID=A0A1M6EQ35_9CLOT|nr:heavy metal-associated domain-containing protein [Clostridium cavendishii]SHI87574.1 Copper chaperone CopZ [Clostridium cavendishii DSM 21758]